MMRSPSGSSLGRVVVVAGALGVGALLPASAAHAAIAPPMDTTFSRRDTLPSSRERIAQLVRLNARFHEAAATRRQAIDAFQRGHLTSTVDVEYLHLTTSPALVSRVQRAAERAATVANAQLTPALRKEVNNVRFFARPDSTEESFLRRARVALFTMDDRDSRRVSGHLPDERVTEATDEGIARALLDELAQRVYRSLAPDVQSWLGTDGFPMIAPRAQDLANVRLELGASSSRYVRDCLTTRTANCVRALGLDAPSTVSWRDFHDAADLPGVVAELSDSSHGGRVAPRVKRECVNGVAPSCVIALQQAGSAVRFPSVMESRRSLMAEALSAGGAESLSRLQATNGTLRQKLEAASGLPVERLMQRWRAHILAVAPRPDVPADAAAYALAFSVVMAGITATRRRTCA